MMTAGKDNTKSRLLLTGHKTLYMTRKNDVSPWQQSHPPLNNPFVCTTLSARLVAALLLRHAGSSCVLTFRPGKEQLFLLPICSAFHGNGVEDIHAHGWLPWPLPVNAHSKSPPFSPGTHTMTSGNPFNTSRPNHNNTLSTSALPTPSISKPTKSPLTSHLNASPTLPGPLSHLHVKFGPRGSPTPHPPLNHLYHLHHPGTMTHTPGVHLPPPQPNKLLPHVPPTLPTQTRSKSPDKHNLPSKRTWKPHAPSDDTHSIDTSNFVTAASQINKFAAKDLSYTSALPSLLATVAFSASDCYQKDPEAAPAYALGTQTTTSAKTPSPVGSSHHPPAHSPTPLPLHPCPPPTMRMPPEPSTPPTSHPTLTTPTPLSLTNKSPTFMENSSLRSHSPTLHVSVTSPQPSTFE